MNNNPYQVLDLPEDSSYELLEARYKELKAKYGEQRFATGEEGNEGAKKLMELEDAWKSISADAMRRQSKEKFGGDYGQIDDLIKKAKYDEAQAMLDSVTDRSAEWHYLQSIIFYKREWMTESRKQLKMASDMEPGNEKYKSALEKLEMVMGNPNANARNLGQEGPTPMMGDMNGAPGQGMGGNCLGNCCCAYCLTDLCCNMARCCG